MKNSYVKLAIALSVLIAVGTALFFVLQGDEKCSEHIDVNIDGKCDVCAYPLGREEPICEECNNLIDECICDSEEEPQLPEQTLCDECHNPIDLCTCDSEEEPQPPEEILCDECHNPIDLCTCDSEEEPQPPEQTRCDECLNPIDLCTCDSEEEPQPPEEILCDECHNPIDLCTCDSEEEPQPPEEILCDECHNPIDECVCESGDGEDLPDGVPCTKCSDANADGVCDNCKQPIEPEFIYEVNSFLIAGKAISDYVIAYDNSHIGNSDIAYDLQGFIYRKSGLLLEVIATDSLTVENYIAIKTAPKSGNEGFYVTLNGENLEITSEFYNKTQSTLTSYLEGLKKDEDSNVEFTEQTVNVRDVSYESFGAVGDGITDDSMAIAEAHKYANEYGHTVVADKNARYYIASTTESIEIRTDTEWNDATFIIDDRNIDPTSAEVEISIFEIASDHQETLAFDAESEIVKSLLSFGKLTSTAKSLNVSFGYSALLIIENESQKAVILIDKDGNIDDSTPLQEDFESVTRVYVRRTDDAPISVGNANFIHMLAPFQNGVRYARNISVTRSNVTLSVIKYYTESDAGNLMPYASFISVCESSNVLMSGMYLNSRPFLQVNGEKVQSHTVSISDCANVTLKTCHELNMFEIDGITPRLNNSDYLFCADSQNIKIELSRFAYAYADEGVYGIDIDQLSQIIKFNYK